MKESFQFTPHQLTQYMEESLQEFRKLASFDFPFDRETLLMEDDVCKILRISPRTLRNYIRKGLLHPVKMQGRNYFLKVLLFMDFLELYSQQYGK